MTAKPAARSPYRYTLDAGRCIVRDCEPIATIHGVGRYDPCEIDTFARDAVAALNNRSATYDQGYRDGTKAAFVDIYSDRLDYTYNADRALIARFVSIAKGIAFLFPDDNATIGGRLGQEARAAIAAIEQHNKGE